MADVLVEVSTLPTDQYWSTEIVPVTVLALLKTAVSWAKGKLLMFGVPPESGAHPAADQICDPAKFQYTVFAAGNVMPELLPLSPKLVPEMGAAAPEMVMPPKSALATLADVLTVKIFGAALLLLSEILELALEPVTTKLLMF